MSDVLIILTCWAVILSPCMLAMHFSNNDQ